jgi:hypothetical protein
MDTLEDDQSEMGFHVRWEEGNWNRSCLSLIFGLAGQKGGLGNDLFRASVCCGWWTSGWKTCPVVG